jgi:hypothetical protein
MPKEGFHASEIGYIVHRNPIEINFPSLNTSGKRKEVNLSE